MLCKIVPPTRAAAPKESEVPTGPDISENLGKATPAPTYEDMLKTVSDENIFEYYSTAQLAIVPLVGTAHMLPVKGLIDSLTPRPMQVRARLRTAPPFQLHGSGRALSQEDRDYHIEVRSRQGPQRPPR